MSHGNRANGYCMEIGEVDTYVTNANNAIPQCIRKITINHRRIRVTQEICELNWNEREFESLDGGSDTVPELITIILDF